MSILEYLEKHLPTTKAYYILSFLVEHKCVLKITKQRKTKRGDFRQNGPKLSISVNHDTNTYRFLFTLVHEIAHLKTFLEYRHTVKPHGDEWKANFKELFTSLDVADEFKKDEQMFAVVSDELINPKACSGLNIRVEKAFSKYDEKKGTYLEELMVGARFTFGVHTYEKLENRRSRVMCLNLSNNRKYTINKAALVQVCKENE